MNFCCFFLVSVFVVAATAFPASSGNPEHPVMACISDSGLNADDIEAAVSPVGPLGDEQTSFVKCVLMASQIIDDEENFQYDVLKEIYTARYKNYPDQTAKFEKILETCKGLSGAVAVKGCIESNGGKIF